MDKSTPLSSQPTQHTGNGVFIRGVVVSNRARLFAKKDKTGNTVLVEHEIATQPGVVTWSRYFDPATDAAIKIEGTAVKDFPKLKEFSTVLIKAHKLRTSEHTGEISIRFGELCETIYNT